jgi:hypothetical protein
MQMAAMGPGRRALACWQSPLACAWAAGTETAFLQYWEAQRLGGGLLSSQACVRGRRRLCAASCGVKYKPESGLLI